ncbi:hypothetical protein L6164_021274 [Bauhinia variegata]|uniref:Uncharacterized protein n=1 Tax=Bauhinia variegata TaxID=167791 RepID=A0ACB9MY10_BAUVA|nr:hypothetical protein L6164_021274 [Bauhinia variegata]
MKKKQYQKRVTATTSNTITIAKPTAYFILLLLTYTLGYWSAPSSTSTHQLPDSFRVTDRCAEPIPSELARQTLLDRLFNGSSPFQDFPPEHAAKLLRPTRVQGWGSYRAVFEKLIRRVNPSTIVEVGTFLGPSALHMAELTLKMGLQTQIICIDDFRASTGSMTCP